MIFLPFFNFFDFNFNISVLISFFSGFASFWVCAFTRTAASHKTLPRGVCLMRMVVARGCAKTDSCFPLHRGHTLSARKMRQKGPASATFQWIQPSRPRCGARVAVARARGLVSLSLVYCIRSDHCISLSVCLGVRRVLCCHFHLRFALFSRAKEK